MELIAGFLLALAVGLLARAVGFDKDRSFYATILIVIASYYLLFAAMASASHAWIPELIAFSGFALVAVLGASRWPVLIVMGLVAHAVFDAVHGQVIANPGIPVWWPGFCLAYDLTAGAFYGGLILRRHGRSARRKATA